MSETILTTPFKEIKEHFNFQQYKDNWLTGHQPPNFWLDIYESGLVDNCVSVKVMDSRYTSLLHNNYIRFFELNRPVPEIINFISEILEKEKISY